MCVSCRPSCRNSTRKCLFEFQKLFRLSSLFFQRIVGHQNRGNFNHSHVCGRKNMGSSVPQIQCTWAARSARQGLKHQLKRLKRYAPIFPVRAVCYGPLSGALCRKDLDELFSVRPAWGPVLHGWRAKTLILCLVGEPKRSSCVSGSRAVSD